VAFQDCMRKLKDTQQLDAGTEHCEDKQQRQQQQSRDGSSRSRNAARTERESLRGSLVKEDQKFEEKVSFFCLFKWI
jgi:hypothetical protein